MSDIIETDNKMDDSNNDVDVSTSSLSDDDSAYCDKNEVEETTISNDEYQKLLKSYKSIIKILKICKYLEL